MTTIDLLLHPVGLRIVQALLGGRELTTAQLSAERADVPSTKLYRHISLLLNAEVLTVVGQRQIRGARERIFALRLERTKIEAGDLQQLSREDHLQAFATFVAGLLANYERYLQRGGPDLVRDGVSYSMNALWLSDAEYAELLSDVVHLVAPGRCWLPRRGCAGSGYTTYATAQRACASPRACRSRWSQRFLGTPASR